MELISVIVPVYRVQESYLRMCIESILEQEHKELELILVDDGSPDNAGNICDEYKAADGRIKVIHQENQGVSAARNHGIQAAKGDWICFVDADDWLEKNALRTVIESIEGKDTDMAVWNLYQNFSSRETVRKNYPASVWVKETKDIEEAGLFLLRTISIRKDELKITTLSLPFCHLYKNSLIKEYAICFDPTLKQGEDKLFNYQYYMHIRNFLYINIPLYHYRIHQESTTQTFFKDQVDTSTRILQKYYETEPRIHSDIRYQNTYYIRVMYIAWFLIGRYYLKKGESMETIVREFSSLMQKEPYREAICRVQLSEMSFSMTKVRLWVLRHGMYRVLFWDVRRENK